MYPPQPCSVRRCCVLDTGSSMLLRVPSALVARVLSCRTLEELLRCKLACKGSPMPIDCAALAPPASNAALAPNAAVSPPSSPEGDELRLAVVIAYVRSCSSLPTVDVRGELA
jgi:hypothetical protein